MKIAIVDDLADERALLKVRLEKALARRSVQAEFLEYESGEAFLQAANAERFAAAFLVNRRFFSYLVVSLAALLLTAVCQMLGVWASDGVSWCALGTAALQTLWSLPMAALLYFPARFIAGRDWE